MTWYLVKIYCWNKPYWVQALNKHYWKNAVGGRVPRQDSDVIYEKAEGEYEDLDHTKTGLVVEQSDTGWLSRTGRWYPCEIHCHSLYAGLIFKMTSLDLLRRGWVEVYNKKEWNCLQSVSSEQHEWLLKHDHKVEEWDL